MKMFEGMQNFFESIGEYIKGYSNLFFIFLGVFLLMSIIVIFLTSFAYECMLTKTIDKINKFLERNPRINDDNLVAFNNLMKANSVPKTLRRQWQQFMLYREHSASHYMSFKHCVENPMRNSAYTQQMTIYKIISYVLVVLSLVVGAFMAELSYYSTLVLQEILIIPITILVLYWLISMVLNLIHNAISSDLFQNYQYFEINMDKAMLTLPEFVDYEVLFSQDEIRRGIPVLYAYLQKRAIQEQQELEKARLKSVDHEKFDFDSAGLDGSLVLDRAMRETENFTAQRKKYLQEIERVNNEIAVLENNYKEQVKDYQRKVQTSKETVENLKEQLEQASSTIEINYIKKQMRDELNRQQISEKDFDILTDKHNQEIKSLNQEIKQYDEETKRAKEALESAMLSEFSTYSVKVYDNLEKIVDEKMQGKIDEYKEQIKGLEGQLEERSEELENVYTRYQEVLSQVPETTENVEPIYEEVPTKKTKKKKKGLAEDVPADNGMVQPGQEDYNNTYPQEYDYSQDGNYQEYNDNYQQDYDYNADYNYNSEGYDEQYPQQEYQDYDNQEYNAEYDYVPAVDDTYSEDNSYVPLDENVYQPEQEYSDMDYSSDAYNNSNEEYVPLNDFTNDNQEGEYVPLNDYSDSQEEYIPLNQFDDDGINNVVDSVIGNDANTELDVQNATNYNPEETKQEFDDDFNDNINDSDNMDFDFSFKDDDNDESFNDTDFDIDFGDMRNDDKKESTIETEEDVVDDSEFDVNDALGLYDNLPNIGKKKKKVEKTDILQPKEEEELEKIEEQPEEEDWEDFESAEQDELPAPELPKRKAGRPRKIVDESEIKPKRSVGRPRKIVEDDEPKEKRSVGRPRKVVELEESEEPKRRVGRPRKAVEDVESPKRRVGRPRKATLKRQVGRPRKEDKEIKVSRSVGRPRKEITELQAPKRKVGRPRKEINRKPGRPKKTEIVKQTKKVGRPKKVDSNKATRKVGRPRKEIKRKVGRPKKSK